MMTVKMAVPNKGRLNERAVELLAKAGIDLGEDWGRRLRVCAEDQGLEIMLVRAQDIPAFISSGAIDIGITGEDMVAESGYNLRKMLDLEFGHCRLSVAAQESSGIGSVDDVPNGARIATSFPNLTEKFFASKGKKVEVIEISGAAEIMPYLGVSDLICDLVATGSTLKTNRLVEIGKIIDSQAAVFTSDRALASKKAEIADIVDSIGSVMAAEGRKYLMADIPKDRLSEVQRMLPGIGGPTVLNIAGNDSVVAVHAVVDSKDVYRTVNDLKKIGAKGILTLSIDRLVE
ncbi:MAG: ATP phosphoribosyltransferase [Candidatus Methanoplasma sp.]|jgi:ATP phosphoribosyltransferase|nr:ATP phosphoribosyltransferase [Candidatus Methanoplasma sp.]